MNVDHAAIEQELGFVDAAAAALRNLAPWRLLRAWELIGDARSSLRRAMTLARHKGSLWFDIKTWLPSILLSLFPFDILAKALLLLSAITATISRAMTYNEDIPRERTTVRIKSIWIFWTEEVPTTENYLENVAHRPPPWIPFTVAVVVIIGTSLACSWSVLRFWAWRASSWAKWLRQILARQHDLSRQGLI